MGERAGDARRSREVEHLDGIGLSLPRGTREEDRSLEAGEPDGGEIVRTPDAAGRPRGQHDVTHVRSGGRRGGEGGGCGGVGEDWRKKREDGKGGERSTSE